MKSQNSSVSITMMLWAVIPKLGLDSEQGQDFSYLHNIQISCAAYPTSYLMDTRASICRGKQLGM
jgi:hypothetical protein